MPEWIAATSFLLEYALLRIEAYVEATFQPQLRWKLVTWIAQDKIIPSNEISRVDSFAQDVRI